MSHDIARQLVTAYPDFRSHGNVRWCVGREGITYTAHAYRGAPRQWGSGHWFNTCAVLDLSDPATGGILLARLWAIDPRARVDRYDDVVRVTVNGKACGPVDYEDRDDDGRWWFYVTGPTLGHACAAALVALTTPPTEG